MFELRCPASSFETVALRFSPKHESGSVHDDRATWHGSARHRSRIPRSQLPSDNCIPNQASQRSKLRFQSQFWHSCEVCLPPLDRAQEGILLSCSHCSQPIRSVPICCLMFRALREDIPCMLQRSPNMDIFADNIAFTDNISPRMGHQTNIVQGVEAYSRQLWSLRFHAALLFSRSHVSCTTCLFTA